MDASGMRHSMGGTACVSAHESGASAAVVVAGIPATAESALAAPGAVPTVAGQQPGIEGGAGQHTQTIVEEPAVAHSPTTAETGAQHYEQGQLDPTSSTYGHAATAGDSATAPEPLPHSQLQAPKPQSLGACVAPSQPLASPTTPSGLPLHVGLRSPCDVEQASMGSQLVAQPADDPKQAHTGHVDSMPSAARACADVPVVGTTVARPKSPMSLFNMQGSGEVEPWPQEASAWPLLRKPAEVGDITSM